MVEAAKEDDSIPVDDEEIKEQVLGDTDGDLGEAMEQAAEQGKEQRRAEEEGNGGEMGEGSGVVGNKDQRGVGEDQASLVNTGEAEAEVGDKRKREDGDSSMDVEESAKKARTGEGEMQMDVRTEDGEAAHIGKPTVLSCSLIPYESACLALVTDTPSAPSRDPVEDAPNPLPHAQHPPTKALYIDNFRRPLDVPALKELLEDQGELDSTEVSGGVWISGVKSHVYAMVSRPCPPRHYPAEVRLQTLTRVLSSRRVWVVQDGGIGYKGRIGVARPRIPTDRQDAVTRRVCPLDLGKEPDRAGGRRMEGRQETDDPGHPDRTRR